MEDIKFLKCVERLVRRGVGVMEAASLLKQSEIDAIGDILIEKGICTKKEFQKCKDIAYTRVTRQVELVSPKRPVKRH